MGIRSVWSLAVGALLCATQASAQWVPRWIGVWQHPEHWARASRIRVDADGSVFALVRTLHDYAILVRFGRDGDFAWQREAQSEPLGIALFDGGGVAVASRTQVDEYDRSSGKRLRHCQWRGAVSGVDDRYETQPLAQSPRGDVLFAAAAGDTIVSGGDFVVLRCDRQGNILPTWHWPFSGYRTVTGIVAFPDGGASITGAGRPGERAPGAYYTVRFDAEGRVLFVDTEPGDLGSPDGPVRMLADAEGSLLLVAVPENFAGNLGAIAWKILPDGRRAWTLRIPDAVGSMGTLTVGGFAVTPEGDVVVAVTNAVGYLRVLRLAGADGQVVWRTELPVTLTVTGFALAANGRILVSGIAYRNDGSSTVTYTRLFELGPDGQLLRTQDDEDMPFTSRAASGCAGWYVLGSGPYDAATSDDAVVKQYDAGFDVACPLDAIFADGFDAAVR